MFSTSLDALFQEYIGLNTSLPSGENYPKAITLLQNFLDRCGFETDDIQIPESVCGKKNRVNLIARRFTSESLPTILIYNHIDTVPASYPKAFTLQFKDGKAFGRGACDHKGSTIAVLDALEKLRNNRLRFNIIFLASTDEETDQNDQLEYITPKLDLPKNSSVLDPDTFAGGMSVAHLGHLFIEVTLKGKSTHSAMSHLGINAVEASAKFIEFFKTIKNDYENRQSKYPPFPFLGIKHVTGRCNVNKISGGSAVNVVPDMCTLSVDCRFIPEENVEHEKIKLLERIKKFAQTSQIDYEITDTHVIEGYFSDHALTHELNATYKEVSGESGLYCVTGSTPIAHWCKKYKLAHFGVGVVREDSNIHGIDEFCYVKDLEILSTTLQRFFTAGTLSNSG